MQISSKFDHTKIEKKWYSFWNKNNFFNSEPDDREPFTIVIPPPNVTGLLHMGHMLNNTIQDILIRKARMMGKNACWGPGTDHASIATEAKVAQELKTKGIHKSSITREKFLESLEVLQSLLSKENFSFKGKYYRFEPITIMPRPIS